MTIGKDRPVVIDQSDPKGEDKGINRSVKRRRPTGRRLPVKAESVLTDDGRETSESSELLSEQDEGEVETNVPFDSELSKPRMPRPTNEVPLFWRHSSETEGNARTDLNKLFDAVESDANIVQLEGLSNVPEQSGTSPVLNVRIMRTDTSGPSMVPRRIENLDLHSLIDLHAHLEAERVDMPGELVVPGKVSGLAVGMLIDSGASVSCLSANLWEKLHSVNPGWTLLSTNCCVRTVSGSLASVRGRLVLEVELAGQYYVHQFMVMDIEEDIILGLDFVHKYDVDCDWRRGVLRLKGSEVLACRRYTVGDGLCRRLVTHRKTVVPAGTQVVVETCVRTKDAGGLPDWGLTSPTQKSIETYGVVAGSALVDPRELIIPIPVMNPGDTDVILPKNAMLGLLTPVVCVGTMENGDGLTCQTKPEPEKVRTVEEDLTAIEADWPPRRKDQFFKKNWSMVSETDQGESDESPETNCDTCGDSPAEQGANTRGENLPGVDCAAGRLNSPPERNTSCAEGRINSPRRGKCNSSPAQGVNSSELPGEKTTSNTVPTSRCQSSSQPMMPSHMEKLYREGIVDLPVEHHSTFANFLCEYQDVFARSSGDLGCSNTVQHRIDTGETQPIKQAPRRVPIHKRKVVKEEVDKMLDRGVIEPCEGPWASPIVLVTKKDGTTRFCVDFRRLNDVTRKDAYPLPRIEDNLDTLQGALYYSTLDLISGYWQVEMAPEHRDKTAFSVSGGGLYRFLQMPFGLCNAPATFQRLMEKVLSGLQWEIAVLYIDDVIVFANSFEEQLENLGLVLSRLRLAGLKLKPQKCELFRKRVEFLGHIVSQKGVEVDQRKISKILEWPEPQNLTQLRSFVGICAYYRRFVPEFSTICKPLFLLTQKGQQFVWGEAQQVAMDTMKTLLTTPPILGYPRTGDEFVLDTDASAVGLGAVLTQVQDGEERVIAYASRVLSQAERNYCTTRRELLAIVSFVKQFHHYLYGGRFLVRTDHSALYWLLRKKEPEGQMARWVTFLQSYDMQVQHRQGIKHGNADALSRCMEGCRDMDALFVPVGTQASLEEIQARAREKILQVTSKDVLQDVPQHVVRAALTRAQAKVEREQEKKHPTIGLNPIKPVVIETTGSTISRGASSELLAESVVSDQDHSKIEPNVKVETPADVTLDHIATEQRKAQFYQEQLPETWSVQAMAFLQETDPDLKKVRVWCREGCLPTWEEVAKENVVVKTWWGRYEQLLLSSNDVLYIRWEATGPLQPLRHRVVAVASMFKSILAELHDAKTAGHQGQKRTMDRAKKSPFYWPGMITYARRWVQNCKVCAARKHPQYSKRTPLQTYRVGATMDRVSIDLVGPFHPATSRGATTILTITDQYSRWVECFPLRRATAPEIALRVVDFVCRLGLPLELHSDQGRNVDGEVMKEVCKLLGIKKTHTTAYHPAGNSITERINGPIKRALSSFVNSRATDWDDHLPAICMAIRSAVNRTLGETPNIMMLGRQLRVPLNLWVGEPPEVQYEVMSTSEYVVALSEAMKEAQTAVSEQLDAKYEYQKTHYDRNVRPQTYTVGQACWLRMFPNIQGRSKSLIPPWDAAWIVVKQLSAVHYTIQKTLRSRTHVVHGDRLRVFYGDVLDPETKRLQDTVLITHATAELT